MNKIEKEAIKFNKRWVRLKKVKGMRRYLNGKTKSQLAWKLMQTML